MRKAGPRLILGLICLGICLWFVAWHHSSEAKRKRGIERQGAEAAVNVLAALNQDEQAIARMVSAHDAVTDWTDSFSGKRFVDSLPSDEIARALMRKDGRPVLVFGSIVAVMTQNQGCKLKLDAKANLVSNIRFLLTCTPAQAKEVLNHRQQAYEEALEEIRGDEGDPESETPERKRNDDSEAGLDARRGYAFVALVNAVHSGNGEAIDDPGYTARFVFAEGRCLELLYVGRDYRAPGGDEAYLRLNTSEDETLARKEMQTHLFMNNILKSPEMQKELNDIPKE